MAGEMLPTAKLFLDAPGRDRAPARVIAIAAEGPGGAPAIALDQTVFYARSGGQPGDTGVLRWQGGETRIAGTVKAGPDGIWHLPAEGAALPPPGTGVEAILDWPRRHRHMRMHTALHLLCALVPGAFVTGGAIGEAKSRLDFDLPAAPDRGALQAGLDALIEAAHPVSWFWVEESVLDTDPGLVRTVSVQPPRGQGRLRMVQIGGDAGLVDRQPCGGTHAASTAEIGRVLVAKIENKGRQNRRIAITLE